MKYFSLFEHGKGQDPHRDALMDYVEGIDGQEVEVYYTHAPSIRADEQDFTFVTTHDITHLTLGRFSHEALRHLGYVLQIKFSDIREKQLIFLKGDGSREGWLVTLTSRNTGHDVTFTFSPAEARIS